MIQLRACLWSGVYHQLAGTQSPAFLQIYFSGPELTEAQTRAGMFSNETNELDVILGLQQMFRENNNYVRCFKSVMEHSNSSNENFKVVIRADKPPPPKTR